MSLMIDQIRLDGGTQARAGLNPDTVADYAEQMQDEATVFPPVIVYHDGKDYWLADGFHRVEAWKRIGRIDIPADVRQGDRRRAILHACAANAAHGLRRTAEDKRRAVRTLLEDAEWSQWSDREIARRCVVSPSTVAKYRAEVAGVTVQMDSEPRTYTTKHGTPAQMDTTQIGKAKADPQDAATGQVPTGADRQEADAPQPPADPHADARKGLSALTREGLEDEVIGLREALAEAKAALKAAKAERDDFKAKWQEALAQDDMGRALGNAQRQRDTAQGRLKEEMTKNARQGRRIKILEAEIAKMKRERENEEITL